MDLSLGILIIVAFSTFKGLPLEAQWWRFHLPRKRHGFDPWVRKILWRRKWQPAPVFLPGEFHAWTKEPGAGNSPRGPKVLDMTEQLNNKYMKRNWLALITVTHRRCIWKLSELALQQPNRSNRFVQGHPCFRPDMLKVQSPRCTLRGAWAVPAVSLPVPWGKKYLEPVFAFCFSPSDPQGHPEAMLEPRPWDLFWPWHKPCSLGLIFLPF